MNKRRVGYILLGIVMALIIVSVFYTPYDPEAMNGTMKFAKPSFSHLFGTDNFGRDILSRVMVGARTSFIIAFVSVALSAITGVVLGAFLGFFGGIVDKIVIRILDAISSFPSVLLALIIVSAFGVKTNSIVIALYIALIPSFTRVMRAEFIKEKNMEYVQNARLLGASSFRLMFIHIFPNTVQVLISSLIVGFNNAILAESALSYLGLGVQPPASSLGRMLANAQSSMIKAPWTAIVPGAVLIILILSISLINDSRPTKTYIEEAKRTKNKNFIYEGASEDKNKLLIVNRLSVSFDNDSVNAVDKVSFYVNKGEILGIVGESGSGKSVTAMSIAGLLGKDASITSDAIIFDGVDISEIEEEKLRELRGDDISCVFQEPMQVFNPLKRIGIQMDEVLRLHTDMAKEGRKNKILESLLEVGIEDNERVYGAYPCELSGGMCQRAMIAMAMLLSPKLLVADEPTTALDKAVALQVLGLLKELNKKYGTSIIFISHDLAMIKEICEDVLVMEKGRIVERASVNTLFAAPKMEYTKELIGSYLGNLKFERYVDDKITKIKTMDLSVGYGSPKKPKPVWENINIEIKQSEVFGICGPSGCGKSTLAKTICDVIKPLAGETKIDGHIGMVFQNPFASLNPAMTVRRLLEEPLLLYGVKDKKQREIKINEMLESVGLGVGFASRKPNELSGGQRQRVAIGMALISNADIVILDEPVSALDATVAKQVLILLNKLADEKKLTYILISHDEMVIEAMCTQRLVFTSDMKSKV